MSLDFWHPSGDTCPSPDLLGLGSSVPGLSMLLFSTLFRGSKSAITNLSLQPTAAWRMPVTNYEAIFLGLIYIKAMALRGLTILPISLNSVGLSEWENYRSNRRRRRSEGDPVALERRRRMADLLLGIVRRLDERDCILNALCELQSASIQGQIRLPKEMKSTLSTFSHMGWSRASKASKLMENDTDCNAPNPPEWVEERSVSQVFEEAVLAGWDSSKSCSESYTLCPLTRDEILHHWDTIKHINVLPISS